MRSSRNRRKAMIGRRHYRTKRLRPSSILKQMSRQMIQRCVFTKVCQSRHQHLSLTTLFRDSGTREISNFERTGGWRLTPEILNISLHFPRAEVTHPCFFSSIPCSIALCLCSLSPNRSRVPFTSNSFSRRMKSNTYWTQLRHIFRVPKCAFISRERARQMPSLLCR